jgi:cell division protein FtsL
VLVSIGVVAGVVLVIVVARVLTGQAGFTETGLSKRIAQHQREVEDLQLQLAKLRAPQRIYTRALELGLVPATHVVYLTPSPRAASSPAPNARVPSSNPSGAPGRGGR